MNHKKTIANISLSLIVLVGILPAVIYIVKILLGEATGVFGDGINLTTASVVFALLFIVGIYLCMVLEDSKKVLLLIPLLCMAVLPLISRSEPDNMPKGAVVAFSLPEGCPKNWQLYSPVLGRTIIGADFGLSEKESAKETKDSPLTQRKLYESGGAEQHKLSVSEMPSHDHTRGDYKYLLKSNSYNTYHGKDDRTKGEPNLKRIARLKLSGGGKPHNNMPPFIALYYCQKM